MGLLVSHGCWDGTYSAFNRWRDSVAKAVGWPGIGKEYPERCYYGWWDKDFPYAHVWEVFFVHSDAGGYIFPKDAQHLVEAMLKAMPKLDGTEPMPGMTGYSPLARMGKFAAGLQRAVEEWEIVRFS